VPTGQANYGQTMGKSTKALMFGNKVLHETTFKSFDLDSSN